MKIYSVVGCTQSGSTLLFNILQLIHDLKKIEYNSSWANESYEITKKIVILKIHDFDKSHKDLCNKIFLPIRDFRDAAISAIKRGMSTTNTRSINKHIIKNIKRFNSWEPYADYIFVYEKYMENKELIILEIANKLEIELNNEEIQLILKKIDILYNSNDIPEIDDFNNELYKKTLLSKQHNTSNGQSKKYLTFFIKKQNKEILQNKQIYNFLKNQNYDINI